MPDGKDQATIRDRLQRALAATYADGWAHIYNDETRRRLGSDHARLEIPSMWEAIRRAGLVLQDASDEGISQKLEAP